MMNVTKKALQYLRCRIKDSLKKKKHSILYGVQLIRLTKKILRSTLVNTPPLELQGPVWHQKIE